MNYLRQLFPKRKRLKNDKPKEGLVLSDYTVNKITNNVLSVIEAMCGDNDETRKLLNQRLYEKLEKDKNTKIKINDTDNVIVQSVKDLLKTHL